MEFGDFDDDDIESFDSDSDDFIEGSWEQCDKPLATNDMECIKGTNGLVENDIKQYVEDRLSLDSCSVNTKIDSDTNSRLIVDNSAITKEFVGSSTGQYTEDIKANAELADKTNADELLLGSPSSQPIERMKLNDHKAGMEGLDKEKINKIIHDASKGSKYYENEKRNEKRVKERIDAMKNELSKYNESDKERALNESNKYVSVLQKAYDFSRTLVHIDMDAFYAAVEMRDNPKLKDIPMAVGGNSMLSTSNYLARRFGVRAAMPGFIARKLCPELIIVPTNFKKYRQVSSIIRDIFKEYDPNFSPMSLDEAYMDLTDFLAENSWKYISVDGRDPIELVVEEIRERIHLKTELTASAGIASNLMLCKICSDYNKPNGQYYLKPDKSTVTEFVKSLPIRKVFGIGKVTEQMLKALDITSCNDLYEKRGLLYLLFSDTSFQYFMRVSLGISSNRITHDERKSMSVERTFHDESNPEKLVEICRKLCVELAGDLQKEGLHARNVTLKYKLSSFVTKTRSKTIPYSVSKSEEIFVFAKELLLNEIKIFAPEKFELRLMGVRVTQFHQPSSKKQNTMEKFLVINNSSSKNLVNFPDKFCSNSRSEDVLVDQQLPSETLDCASQSAGSSKEITEVNRDISENYEVVQCPVCGQSQQNDMISLNAHIDACLNKQTIKQIIHEQNVIESNSSTADNKKSKKRKSTEEHCRVRKKTLWTFWKSP